MKFSKNKPNNDCLRGSTRKRNAVIFAALIWPFFFLSACTTVHLGPSIAPFKEKVISGEGPDKVLLIEITGLINNQTKRSLVGFTKKVGMVERVREILRKADEDEDIKALLLRINTPGGTVTASDIIYHEIKTYKKKKNLKVYVSIMDLAASGGYYIAMAADTIVAHPTSITGSIGVIALKLNLQGLFSKIGVDWEVVKSASKKDFMSPFRPFTPEERKLFQETIDSFHNLFVEVIAENRPGLDLEAAKKVADGRVFHSKQALEAKLIDRIGYMDETLELIKQDLGKEKLKVVTYHRPGQYKGTIYSAQPGAPPINLINIDLGLDLELGAPYFMYLWLP